MDERYRGIIIKDDKLVLMKRNRNGEDFFVFPGGGIEKNESPQQCCERELLEEFGIEIEAKNMIYLIHQGESKQGYFVCDWKSGEIHKTDAEEYQGLNHYGTYNPTLANLNEVSKLNILPPEVKEQFLDDLKVFGKKLNRPLIEIECADYKR